jgi:hypothetical protein
MLITAKKRYILEVLDSEGERYQDPKYITKGVEIVRTDTPRTTIPESSPQSCTAFLPYKSCGRVGNSSDSTVCIGGSQEGSTKEKPYPSYFFICIHFFFSPLF